jgi:NAD-dependent dihydropyrimidine dehydrogenase PreA subunit
MKKTVGEGCDYSLENCLHFGSMGRYMVEHGMAREITVEETLNILKDANEEGLVHIIDNVEGHMSTICNCCGCCCVFLDTQKKMGIHAISSSNYIAGVNFEACVGCGTCEERCPMEAIAVKDDGVAEVHADLCAGLNFSSALIKEGLTKLKLPSLDGRGQAPAMPYGGRRGG